MIKINIRKYIRDREWLGFKYVIYESLPWRRDIGILEEWGFSPARATKQWRVLRWVPYVCIEWTLGFLNRWV